MSNPNQTPQNQAEASPWQGKQSISDKARELGLDFMSPRLAGLVVEAVTNDQVKLRWISHNSKTTPLRIVRSTAQDFKNEHEVHCPKDLNGVVDDDGLAANTLYYYKLIFSCDGREHAVTVDTYTMPAP